MFLFLDALAPLHAYLVANAANGVSVIFSSERNFLTMSAKFHTHSKILHTINSLIYMTKPNYLQPTHVTLVTRHLLHPWFPGR